MKLEDVKKPRYYTLKEVAAFMEVSYNTLRKMVRDGKIKAIDIAKSGTRPIYSFRAEDVQAYYAALPHTSRRLEEVDQ